ncbi:MAG: hypothetical protein FWF02_03355 [Micrococcales bacterium]|nr:hypothetical protein [Micrococcales bacterium]MCL2666725.1 hypothetical protein [Micrococcales bacterium]
MELHEFTIYLDRPPVDEEYDALYEAGFDDSTPGTHGGRGVIHVHRRCESLAEAIISAWLDAARAGFRVVALEDEDLVSLKTVAQRVGRTYESVRLLANGKRGPGGFPPVQSGDGWTLVSWAATADWFATHYGADVTSDEHARTIAAADHLLRARALGIDLAPLVRLAAA